MSESYQKKELKLLSIATGLSVVYAAVAVGIAIISDSVTLMLDSAYSVIDLLVSFAAIFVVRKLQEPPNREYPFGYAKFEPLVTGADGLLLLFLCFMCIFTSLQDLVNPDPVNHLGAILVFTGSSVFLCVGMGLYMQRAGRKWRSEILVTDSKLWLMEGMVSLGVCLAFGICWFLKQTPGGKDYTTYVDPLVCIVIAVFFIVSPFRILKRSMKDLTDASPSQETLERFQSLVECCREKHGLAGVEWFRVRKSGRRLFLNAGFLAQQNYDMSMVDQIRREISTFLKEEEPELDLTLEFTGQKEAEHPAAAVAGKK